MLQQMGYGEIEPVTIPEIDETWPHIAGAMEAGCEKMGGGITHDWLWGECRTSRSYLLVIRDETTRAITAAVVISPQNWKGRRILRVQGACGVSVVDWVDKFTKNPFWPNYFGCKEIYFDGPRAWKKHIPEARIYACKYVMEVPENG